MASLKYFFDILCAFMDVQSDYEYRISTHIPRLRYLQVSLLQTDINVLVKHCKFLMEMYVIFFIRFQFLSKFAAYFSH